MARSFVWSRNDRLGSGREAQSDVGPAYPARIWERLRGMGICPYLAIFIKEDKRARAKLSPRWELLLASLFVAISVTFIIDIQVYLYHKARTQA
jgi:hypothetical protein